MSRIATNLTVVDQALVSGTNFITGLVLARFLGIEAYGLFILLSGVILFTSNIQNAIIISPMMVNGPARQPVQARQYYQATAILQSVLILLFFMLIITAGSTLNHTIINGRIDGLILPLALAASGLLMQEFFRRYFFSNKNTIQALINDILSYGLQLLTIIIVHLLYGLSVEYCLYIMAATSFIAVIHGVLTSGLMRNISTVGTTAYKDISIEHWEFGKWLVARNLAYWTSTQFVIYLTGIMLSTAAVGAMGAARNIVGIVNILFLALDNFATPRASYLYIKYGKRGLSEYIRRLTIIGGSITTIIALIASIKSELWLNIVYNDEYTNYGWVVIAWSLFYVIGFFQRPIGLALRVLNSTKSIFVGTLFSMFVAITCTYPAILIWGFEGAMGSLITVQATITVLYYWMYSSKLKMS